MLIIKAQIPLKKSFFLDLYHVSRINFCRSRLSLCRSRLSLCRSRLSLRLSRLSVCGCRCCCVPTAFSSKSRLCLRGHRWTGVPLWCSRKRNRLYGLQACYENGVGLFFFDVKATAAAVFCDLPVARAAIFIHRGGGLGFRGGRHLLPGWRCRRDQGDQGHRGASHLPGRDHRLVAQRRAMRGCAVSGRGNFPV